MSYMNTKNFGKVVGYIYRNIDKPLTLDMISNEVGLSVSTLKRLFNEAISQSPGNFIRRLRMEFAFKSLQSKDESILEIALASGFEDHAAFSRQFKQAFGFSPTHARKKLNIVNKLESIELEEPDIAELETFEIQAVTESGLYYESAPRAWKMIQDKLHSDELGDDFGGAFIGICHDDPHAVEEDKIRYTAGVAFLERDLGLDHVKIAGGKYARFRYVGKPANIDLAFHHIYGNWEQTNPFQIDRDAAIFCIYDSIADGFKERNIIINVPII